MATAKKAAKAAVAAVQLSISDELRGIASELNEEQSRDLLYIARELENPEADRRLLQKNLRQAAQLQEPDMAAVLESLAADIATD